MRILENCSIRPTSRSFSPSVSSDSVFEKGEDDRKYDVHPDCIQKILGRILSEECPPHSVGDNEVFFAETLDKNHKIDKVQFQEIKEKANIFTLSFDHLARHLSKSEYASLVSILLLTKNLTFDLFATTVIAFCKAHSISVNTKE